MEWEGSLSRLTIGCIVNSRPAKPKTDSSSNLIASKVLPKRHKKSNRVPLSAEHPAANRYADQTPYFGKELDVDYALTVLQLFVALGIFNVWFLRAGKETAHRGGDAKNMREEFAVYGLSYPAMLVIGALKVIAAAGLVVGVFVPVVTLWSAGLLGVLMAGAVSMHLKVRDNFTKTYPAVGMLLFCGAIAMCWLETSTPDSPSPDSISPTGPSTASAR